MEYVKIETRFVERAVHRQQTGLANEHTELMIWTNAVLSGLRAGQLVASRIDRRRQNQPNGAEGGAASEA